ncbi:hypothetical protein QUV83_10820 [Cellulomonas cellasea]|uniref:DUF4190 domain-containing protein n=1 Tax=Cellulomonas cellasea TaxID=43670 RepID=UPI0025A43DF0|nr:hypothetical protein [Cellulomonas cellasea]MDM8085257.1 hypothetical protein [Cellulomonas cellasea]
MSDPQVPTDPTRPIPAQPEGPATITDEAATPDGAVAEGSVLTAEAAPDVEAAPVEEAPADAAVDAPADDALADDALVDEAPADVPSADDAPAEDALVDEAPVDEAPSATSDSDAATQVIDAADATQVIDAADVPDATPPAADALASEPIAGAEPPPYAATAYPAQGAPAPTGTDGMAIAGLVLAFLVWPVGLGLSIAALVRTRRSGRPGKGLAIAGIAVAALAFVLSVISTIYWVTAGIALVEAEEERIAAAAEKFEAESAEAAEAAELLAAEEAAAAAAESVAPPEVAAPVVEGSLLLPASVAGLTGVERGCEILFADDPQSFYSIITTADAAGPDEATVATLVQLVETAKPDLGAEHAADADALLALFRPETQALPEQEMIAALTEGSSAAERLAVACVGGL